MADDRTEPQLQLIRESLEGVLAPGIASAALLEALETYGERMPQEPSELQEFARGSLRAAVQRRAGADVAEEVTHQLGNMLVAFSGGAPDEPEPEGRVTREGRALGNLTTVSGSGPGTARMVVVAGSTGLAVRLRTAVGGERLALLTTHDPSRLYGFVTDLNASLVLYDATDSPQGDVSEFVEALAKLPPDVVRIVWSSGEPEASRIVHELEERDVRVTPLDRREGVDPLLDLLRARW
jgi:hypothetical protein